MKIIRIIIIITTTAIIIIIILYLPNIYKTYIHNRMIFRSLKSNCLLRIPTISFIALITCLTNVGKYVYMLILMGIIISVMIAHFVITQIRDCCSLATILFI